MKRANIPNQEACQTLLLRMRNEGLINFDIHGGRWQIKGDLGEAATELCFYRLMAETKALALQAVLLTPLAKP